MSKLIDDYQFKNLLSNLELTRWKLGNGNIAIGLSLKDTMQRVILKEFRGDWAYRKFIIEAVMLRNSASPRFKELKEINQILTSFYKFLREKEQNAKDII